ncbi:hypothetical protein ACJ73_03359 [Blastomyces percursus]|uniref:Glutamyl/glutaminyl-tRNA synthetase class Ib catalytic domain-containing protein n=1 Tax=Blastomyces percursus TaxID=1658174 RepID=A0A1J9QA09_9EURO|nr:hypothetical protein ACJ73_03359 [Blastomyces percursus]
MPFYYQPSLLRRLRTKITLLTQLRLYEDADVVGPSKEYLKLDWQNGDICYDQGVLVSLQEKFKLLQTDNKDLVLELVTRSLDLTPSDIKAVNKPLLELEHHLTLRSYIVGHSMGLVETWGRWFAHVESTNPWIAQAVLDLNAPARQKRVAGSAAGGNYDIGLDMEGIVTRFPPEPSGYLHIGHAKTALLNDYFAHKNPGATLICLFDDTNPSKETAEFQDAILHDLGLLGITTDRITYSSDNFQLMYELCVKLISRGNAYADDTDKDTMNDERRDGIASKRET